MTGNDPMCQASCIVHHRSKGGKTGKTTEWHIKTVEAEAEAEAEAKAKAKAKAETYIADSTTVLAHALVDVILCAAGVADEEILGCYKIRRGHRCC